MSEPAWSLSDAAEALRRGELSSVELVEQAINRADTADELVGCFVTRYVDASVRAARRADAARKTGSETGPLHGIPVGIKDVISTAEGPTTAHSIVPLLHPYRGDATSVARLRAAGAIIMGKLTTMEFALGRPDPRKPFPVPRNPWDLARWPGGSSTGSASAVAIGAVQGALGTDAAGSIRIPAAYCGVTGLKPTFGRVPKSGCVPLSFSLDTVGPIARSARDCALLLDVIAGYDPTDPSSAPVPVSSSTGTLTGELGGLRIGVDRLGQVAGEFEHGSFGELFTAATAALASTGGELVEIELPHYTEMTIADKVIMIVEALSYHLPRLRTHWDDFNPSTRTMLAEGLLIDACGYVRAQRVRRSVQRALESVFEHVDLVVTPLAVAPAPRYESFQSAADSVFSSPRSPICAAYWNAAGNPAISVPIGFTAEGLPLAMQIAGPPFGEALVLRAADAFQRLTQWHSCEPALGSAR